MDFLLTWNFNHINNAVLKYRIIRSIESQGYEYPVICSPEELMGELKKDPIEEEVRQTRDAHAAKFNYDLQAICKDLKDKRKRL